MTRPDDAAAAGPRNTTAARPDVVVVGGGIAGLVAAHALVARGLRPLVLEAGERCGGYLAGGTLAPSLTVDVGAESFAVRGGSVAALAAELGLEVVEPSGLSAWGHAAGRSYPLPRAGVLGIPGHPWAADVRRALGVVGSARAALDRVLPASRVVRSDLASLVRSRLGRRVLDRLVTPVAGGVHSTDPALLAVDSVAPGLLAAYDRTGSLTAAVRALRAQAPPGSAVAGISGGMHRVVDALVEAVTAEGGIRTGTSVVALERPPVGAGDAPAATRAARAARAAGTGSNATTDTTTPVWVLRTSTGEEIRTPRVVVATSGGAASRLLAGVVDASGAAPARGADIALVTLLLTAPALDAAPRGTGVLAAPGAGVSAKATTHATAKWPWLRAAVDEQLGAGHHVVRLSYGRSAAPGTAEAPRDTGGPSPEQLDDAALVARAVADAAVLYGIPLTDEQVLASLVTRWDDALPPPTPAHRERVGRLQEEVRALPGLAVTGAWVAGTGLAAVVPHARAAADAVAPRG